MRRRRVLTPLCLALALLTGAVACSASGGSDAGLDLATTPPSTAGTTTIPEQTTTTQPPDPLPDPGGPCDGKEPPALRAVPTQPRTVATSIGRRPEGAVSEAWGLFGISFVGGDSNCLELYPSAAEPSVLFEPTNDSWSLTLSDRKGDFVVTLQTDDGGSVGEADVRVSVVGSSTWIAEDDDICTTELERVTHTGIAGSTHCTLILPAGDGDLGFDTTIRIELVFVAEL